MAEEGPSVVEGGQSLWDYRHSKLYMSVGRAGENARLCYILCVSEVRSAWRRTGSVRLLLKVESARRSGRMDRTAWHVRHEGSGKLLGLDLGGEESLESHVERKGRRIVHACSETIESVSAVNVVARETSVEVAFLVAGENLDEVASLVVHSSSDVLLPR